MAGLVLRDCAPQNGARGFLLKPQQKESISHFEAAKTAVPSRRRHTQQTGKDPRLSLRSAVLWLSPFRSLPQTGDSLLGKVQGGQPILRVPPFGDKVIVWICVIVEDYTFER